MNKQVEKWAKLVDSAKAGDILYWNESTNEIKNLGQLKNEGVRK